MTTEISVMYGSEKVKVDPRAGLPCYHFSRYSYRDPDLLALKTCAEYGYDLYTRPIDTWVIFCADNITQQ